ncbi:MAG: type II secretion system secretin GspD, partial [Desulfobacterales bacterium]|nr:type II secretion system secretin GspD [Desulfobacterales bacterium]
AYSSNSFAQSKKRYSVKRGQKYVRLDFNDVDIKVFIKFISELTGKNFIIDKKVNAKVTIISPEKVTLKEAYKVFESVLEVHGYATVPSGKLIKIVPAQTARSKSIQTGIDNKLNTIGDRIVSQVIKLKYANPNDIKRLFIPFISRNSVLMAYQPTNTIIITDVASNIKRLLKIISAIDVKGVGKEITVVKLEYAETQKLVSILNDVFKSTSRSKRSSGSSSIKFVADERTNSIIVLASIVDTTRIMTLITLLDKQIPKGKERLHVYYLENANAEELAKTLQSLSTKTTGSNTGKKGNTPVISGSVNITADKATNSLIIIADSDEYTVIENIIQKLDIPRRMVFIECVIMEVNVDKDFNIGSDWTVGDSKVAGGFSNSQASNQGFFLGYFAGTIEVAGNTVANLTSMVRLYQKDSEIHILSTPQILATENEESSINVSENIPYLTKAASGEDNYNQYEYKDVGISLKITPSISKNKRIRLKIEQTTSKISSTSVEFRPSTLKREINTSVIVDDKNTIVIGGLIDNSLTRTEYKVPCLGDIPLLGWFFKYKGENKKKTNLYIFLTPHVVENRQEALDLGNKKRKEIDKILNKSKIKLYYDEDEKDPEDKDSAKKSEKDKAFDELDESKK